MNAARCMIAAVLALAACRGKAADRATQAPTLTQDATMSSKTLTWRSHTPTIAGISLDVVDGVPVGEGDIGSFHYVSQTSPSVQIDLWIGPDISLAWWRNRFGSRGATFGVESAVTVCGRSGLRQEVSVPAQQATGVQRTEGGNIGHLHSTTPSEVHIALAGFTANSAPFVVAWRIPAGRRDALRADEAHFFSSIRCR